MHLIGNRPHHRSVVEPIAHRHGFDIGGKLGADRLIDGIVHIKPFERGAGLAHVEERAPEQPLGNRLGIGIGQNDPRIIAAQLQRHAFHRRRGRGGDFRARRGRSGEDDFADIGMLRHQRAQIVLGLVAGDDIEHACGQHFVDQLDIAQGRERGIGRGLAHDRIARAQRRKDMPSGDHHRPVPRRDRGDNAQRLAMLLDAAFLVIGQNHHRRREGAGVMRPADHAADFEPRAEARQRLALFAGDQLGELIGMIFDLLRDGMAQGRALGIGGRGPSGEGGFRGGDGGVQIGLGALRRFADQRARRRIGHVECCGRGHAFAVDDHGERRGGVVFF